MRGLRGGLLGACMAVGVMMNQTVAHAETPEIIISRGECLSCIAEEHVGHPVYGPEGSMALILERNPWITDIHEIPVGARITLPVLQSMEQVFVIPDVLSPECRVELSKHDHETDVQVLYDRIDALEARVNELSSRLDAQESQHTTKAEIEPVPAQWTAFIDRKRYYAGLGFLFHRIDGTDTVNDTTAEVLSDLSWQLEFGWITPFRNTDAFYTHIHTHVQYYRYSDDLTGSTVADQSIFAPGIHVGIGRNFLDKRLSVEPFVGVDREFYFFTSNLNQIEFDADWIGKMGLNAHYQVLRKSNWNAGLRSRVEVLGFGGFLDDGGWHLMGSLYAQYKKHELRSNFTYGSLSATQAEFDTYELTLAYRMYF